MNEDYYHEQNFCCDSNSFGFDDCQPPQYTVNHPIFNTHHDYLDSQKELSTTITKLKEQMKSLTSFCEMTCQIFQKKLEEKLTPSEPIDSLSMRDEHLNTIPATESDEVIKSCIEDLVPNPSESEGENGCDVPSCFTTFSNILFDDEYEFDSIDDQSLHNEDFSEKICSNPLFEEQIRSMLNRDSSIIFSSSKIDSLLDEFAGELALLKSIPPGV
nr:hypothetical protein [Tanacetum cinerariifolium]